jgi:hypothetical protein
MELEFYRIQKSPLLDSVSGQLNSAQTYFFKVSFIILIPSKTLHFPERTAVSWIAETEF